MRKDLIKLYVCLLKRGYEFSGMNTLSELGIVWPPSLPAGEGYVINLIRVPPNSPYGMADENVGVILLPSGVEIADFAEANGLG